MRSGRFVVRTVVAVIFVAAIAMYLRHVGSAGLGLLEPTLPLQNTDLIAIESTIQLKLPGISAVRNIALLHGKDNTLFLEIIVPDETASKLKATVSARSRAVRHSDVLWGVPPWFAVSEEKVDSAYEEAPLTYVVFCKPDSGTTVIYIRVSSMSERITTGVYNIFTK